MSREDHHPSPTAQVRLSSALRHRADTYRQDACVDLTIVDALLRLDEPEAAARTLDGHRASLQAMARDLQVVLADAAVEREAEAVCDAVACGPAASPVPRLSGVRRRVLALTGAAAVALALVLPTARWSPRTVLASVEGRSTQDDVVDARERLAAAKSLARALRAEHSATAGADTTAVVDRERVVADSVRAILAAGASGGPAAKAVPAPPLDSAAPAAGGDPATVTDLSEYRARRDAPPPEAAGDDGGPSPGPGDAERDERVPVTEAPQRLDLPVAPDLAVDDSRLDLP